MYMVTCTLHVRLLKRSVSHTCRINDQFPSPYAHIISPPLPDSLPDDLKDLLQKLLEKDQKKRITIPQIREHPWILKSTRPIPSREENCNVEISVSEEDMEQAFKTYRTPIHILVSVGPDCLCLDSILHTSLRQLWYLSFLLCWKIPLQLWQMNNKRLQHSGLIWETRTSKLSAVGVCTVQYSAWQGIYFWWFGNVVL